MCGSASDKMRAISGGDTVMSSMITGSLNRSSGFIWLSVKFPAHGPFTGNFCESKPVCEIGIVVLTVISMAYEEIPYSEEQGIFSIEQGIFPPEQGISVSVHLLHDCS